MSMSYFWDYLRTRDGSFNIGEKGATFGWGINMYGYHAMMYWKQSKDTLDWFFAIQSALEWLQRSVHASLKMWVCSLFTNIQGRPGSRLRWSKSCLNIIWESMLTKSTLNSICKMNIQNPKSKKLYTEYTNWIYKIQNAKNFTDIKLAGYRKSNTTYSLVHFEVLKCVGVLFQMLLGIKTMTNQSKQINYN